jgi:hypothetical protein
MKANPNRVFLITIAVLVLMGVATPPILVGEEDSDTTDYIGDEKIMHYGQVTLSWRKSISSYLYEPNLDSVVSENSGDINTYVWIPPIQGPFGLDDQSGQVELFQTVTQYHTFAWSYADDSERQRQETKYRIGVQHTFFSHRRRPLEDDLSHFASKWNLYMPERERMRSNPLLEPES